MLGMIFQLAKLFQALMNGILRSHTNSKAVRRIIYWPNMAVKGTRRTQAFLKVGSLFGFTGFAKPSQPACPLLLR